MNRGRVMLASSRSKERTQRTLSLGFTLGFCNTTEDEKTQAIDYSSVASSSSATTTEGVADRISVSSHASLTYLELIFGEGIDPNFTKKLIETQKELSENKGRAVLFKPITSPIPMQIVLTHRDIHVLQDRAGKGAQSDVHFTTSIPWDGEAPSRSVVKFSRTSFAPEAALLRDSLTPGSKHSLMIDHVRGTYTIGFQKHVGIFDASECDLSHARYGALPVRQAMSWLIDILDGLGSLHRAKIISRDCKGPNFLVNRKGVGKVTDFGVACIEETTDRTAGTPWYSPAFNWPGGIRDQLLDRRVGCQTRESDMFSVGRTIHRDVLIRLLNHFGEKHGVSVAAYTKGKLQPKQITKQFSPDELVALEKVEDRKKLPGSIIYGGLNFFTQKDTVYIFPPREIFRDNILEAIALFEGKCSEQELAGMRALARIVYDLTNPKRRALKNLTAERVKQELERDLKAINAMGDTAKTLYFPIASSSRTTTSTDKDETVSKQKGRGTKRKVSRRHAKKKKQRTRK